MTENSSVTIVLPKRHKLSWTCFAVCPLKMDKIYKNNNQIDIIIINKTQEGWVKKVIKRRNFQKSHLMTRHKFDWNQPNNQTHNNKKISTLKQINTTVDSNCCCSWSCMLKTGAVDTNWFFSFFFFFLFCEEIRSGERAMEFLDTKQGNEIDNDSRV